MTTTKPRWQLLTDATRRTLEPGSWVCVRGDSGPFEARVVFVWQTPLGGWWGLFGHEACPLHRVVAVMLPPGNGTG